MKHVSSATRTSRRLENYFLLLLISIGLVGALLSFRPAADPIHLEAVPEFPAPERPVTIAAHHGLAMLAYSGLSETGALLSFQASGLPRGHWYEVDFGDGRLLRTDRLVFSHRYQQPGWYQIRVRRYTPEGASDLLEQSIHIRPGNHIAADAPEGLVWNG